MMPIQSILNVCPYHIKYKSNRRALQILVINALDVLAYPKIIPQRYHVFEDSDGIRNIYAIRRLSDININFIEYFHF